MPTADSPTDDVAVLERLVALQGIDAVDIGCGSGWLARAMAARGARVTALEISEAQLAPARAAADTAGVLYTVGRGEQTGLADESQDLVVFMRTLHHVAIGAMGEAVAEARRIVRDGGRVYVAEPLPEGDFFTLVSIVEDETEVRAAARAAIDDAGRAGLRAVACERYEITFALVSIVEDETEVRAAARAAIDGAGRAGLRAVGSERYEVTFALADLDAWIAHTTAVDPRRAGPATAYRDQLAQAFAAGGEVRPDGSKAFVQAVRVDLLTTA